MPFEDLKFRVVSGLFDIAGNFISGQLTKPNYDEREKILDDYYRDAIEVTRKAPKKFRAPPPPPMPEPVQDLTPTKIEGGTACLPCVPPDTMICANPECKTISDIEIGDKVLNRDGEYSKVTQVYTNLYKGQIYDIYVKYKNMPVTVTPEHPVLVTRMKPCHLGKGYCTSDKKTRSCGSCERKCYLTYEPKWMKPKDLFVTKWKSNYTEDKLFLMMPRITKTIDKKVTFLKYYLPKTYRITEENGYLRKTKGISEMKNRIKINTYFMKFVGYYLAEGHTSFNSRGANIVLSFGKTEKEYALEAKRLIEDCFRLNAKITEEPTSLRVTTSSILLGHFLKKLFGDNSHNKQIPTWMLYLPSSKQKLLLEGYFKGDGYIRKEKYNNLSCTTVSPKLANGIVLILERLGIIASFRKNTQKDTKIDGRTIRSNGLRYNIDCWGESAIKLMEIVDKTKLKEWRFRESHATAIEDKFIYYPLKKIEIKQYNGCVMNIETESHDYIANGLCVANCSRDHFSTVSGALNEALRFARKEGMQHPEVEKRIGLALDELNSLERQDLSAENIVKLEGKEKDLAIKGLEDSRNLRHKITTMREVDDLERTAAQASTVRTEFMRNLWGIITIDGTIDKLCKGLSDEERTRCISTINQVLIEKKETPP